MSKLLQFSEELYYFGEIKKLTAVGKKKYKNEVEFV